MMRFSTRRQRNSLVLLLLSVVTLVAWWLSSLSMIRTAIVSGWTLLGLVVFLAAYNVRKKLAFFPLIPAASWLQAHIYCGLFTFVLFAVHVGFRIPNGWFERTLGALYLCVAVSGVLGLAVSRSFARRLTTRGGEVIFERIPRLQARLKADVERLVVRCQAGTESSAIPDFYAARLSAFFCGPRNFWKHLVLSNRPRHNLLVEVSSHDRFLSDPERAVMKQITGLLEAKDDLDFHFAHQAVLKYWLFFHVPLTYALLAFAVVHPLLVYAFSGGLR